MKSAFTFARIASALTTLLVSAAPAPVDAFVITGVNAPDLVRPSDGVLYPFNIAVSGTYNRIDLVFGGPLDTLTVDAQYWDADVFFDDPIDLAGALVIPLANAVIGAAWGPVPVQFYVGCTKDSIVFGPSGNTGENPMNDGYFKFSTGAGLTYTEHGTWGYNTVTCATDASSSTDKSLRRIPEPSSLALAGLGLWWLAGWRNRVRRDNAPRQAG